MLAIAWGDQEPKYQKYSWTSKVILRILKSWYLRNGSIDGKEKKNEKSWICWNGRLTLVILWCEILINTAIYYLAAFNISKCHCKILKKSGLGALNTRILSLTGCRAFSSISLGSYNIFQLLICAMHFIIIIIFKSIK